MMGCGTAPLPSEAAEARACGGPLWALPLRLRRLARDLVDDDAIARLEIALRHLREGGVGQSGDDGHAHGPVVAQDPDAGFGFVLPVSGRPVVTTAGVRIAPFLAPLLASFLRSGVAVTVPLAAGVCVGRLLRAVRREAQRLQRHAQDVVALVGDDA